MAGGRLKVMTNLQNWLKEYRAYHRDDKGAGKIVKRDDHVMDATRYLIVSGREHMRTAPAPVEPEQPQYDYIPDFSGTEWMA